MTVVAIVPAAGKGRRMGADKALGYGLLNAVFDTPELTVAAALQCAMQDELHG
jgi:CTP:molybdopterin cytidylyltransferase MocA